MECQPQNPEFRINPENFHQCRSRHKILILNSLATRKFCMLFYCVLIFFQNQL